MTEQVKNANGLVTGFYTDNGTTITYSSWKHGVLGTFDKVRKQYYRIKTYPGGPGVVWQGQDWGITDILYWDTVK